MVVAAQGNFEMWPGAQYDPALPTVKKVLGFAPGERVASPAELVQYFEALAAAAPGRVKVSDYARSWEKRRLIVAAISSEANLRRLDEIKSAMQRLSDARKTGAAEAKKLMAGLPAVIMLSYGVHGNEISGPDAAMMTAYHLLAARNDALVAKVLQNVVVLIDPTQNPDGRNRFVHNYTVAEGIEPDGAVAAAERNEPWPGGRTNHYYFDMNRDWFAMTQPESRGRVKLLLDWRPLVFADLHEMGTDSTYFFAPGAVPYNPHLTKKQLDNQEKFGENNAKWFDQFGYPYFTREVFDEFYPGYGASWPWFYGGIGMTYENASVRGLLAERKDGQLYDYLHSVQKHFIASLSTCESAANRRAELLEAYYDYQVTAIEEGKNEPTKAYVLPRRGDVSLVDKLAILLADQGVEVRRARDSFTAEGKTYPAGSYVMSLAQPAKRLLRTLLDAKTEMDPKFLAEQERRRKRGLRDEIYDVTAWSLPLMFNIESVAVGAEPAGAFDPVAPGTAPKGSVAGGRATVAYLVPWGGTAAGRFLTAALRAGVVVHSTDKAFAQNGRQYGPGTLIIQVKQNASTVHDAVAKAAEASGAEVIATNSGWVSEGANFGSNNVQMIKRPRIALVWDAPTSASSAGHARYVLERQYGYPVTVIRARQLGRTDLRPFQVLVLPDTMEGYGNDLNAQAIGRLKEWVAGGGTLVALGGGATNFLADSRVGLLATARENAADAGPAEVKPDAEGRVAGKNLATEADYEKAVAAASDLPNDVAGVLVKAKVDQEHWLGAGAPPVVHAIVSGRNIYTPLKANRGANVALFPGADELLASGYLWAENRKQLAFKPLVMATRSSRGVVVAFTADPNYRAYVDGLNVLLLNALFRGPAHTGDGN